MSSLRIDGSHKKEVYAANIASDDVRVLGADAAGLRMYLALSRPAEAVVEVYDVLGRELGAGRINKSGTVVVPFTSTGAGVLFVRLAQGGRTIATARFAILK